MAARKANQHRSSLGSNGAAPPAKLTRPQLHGMLERERLFALLDSRSRGATWINAPAGAGKTTLAASWISARAITCLWYRLDSRDSDPATLFRYLSLTARRAARERAARFPVLARQLGPDLTVFARRFFEELCALHSGSFAIVFDNCHEVPRDAPLHTVILPALLESLPDGAVFVGLSREREPQSLARWIADPSFRLLGSDELRFTDSEAIAFARLALPAAVNSAPGCNVRASGWIMGLKLLLQLPQAELRAILAGGGVMSGRVFEYLAEEVFQRADSASREALLICGLLENFGPDILNALLPTVRADEVLDRLCAASGFIERRELPTGVSYRFRPLFRDFLHAHLARTRSAPELAALRARTAGLLEAHGQLEAATILALESHDPDLLARLILKQAGSLTAQGRFATLECWLLALPDSMREANGWLLYWLALAVSDHEPALGRSILERAYKLFQNDADTSGSWFAAAGILHTYGLTDGSEIDEAISAFENLRAQHGGSLPAAIEPQLLVLLQGALSQRPDSPLSRCLVQRARAIGPILASVDERLALGTLVVADLVWRGDEVDASSLVRQLQADRPRVPSGSLAAIHFDLWRGILLWTLGEFEEARAVLTDGRERCRRVGLLRFEWIFLTHIAKASLGAGDWDAAVAALEEASASAGSVRVPRLLMTTRTLQLGLCGKRSAAGALARELIKDLERKQTLSAAQHACWRCLLSSALLEAGALDEAAASANKALECAAVLPSDRWTFEALILRAGIALERGSERTTLESLEQALRIGAAREFKDGVSLWQAARAARLLALALRHDIMPEYAIQLIKTRRLRAPPNAALDRRWPVALRVQTLGGFAVWLAGEPLGNLSRLPRKPLEVLKAVIGLGPGHVSLASLGRQLWPELEHDAARNACQVAIHRLRKILGAESLLEIHHGAALLNDADSWNDVAAFRELAAQVRSGQAAGARSIAQTQRLARELITLYRGHFLPAEERVWAVTVRERLRSRFVHAATQLSLELERAGAFEMAIELYRHAIDLDPLVESFHRGLLRGLLACGQQTAAVEAFQRCRSLMKRILQVEPSAETSELHARARQSAQPFRL